MVLKLRLKNNSKKNRELVKQAEKKLNDNYESGIWELFMQLIDTGICESYDRKRIFFIAWILESNDIEVKISEC